MSDSEINKENETDNENNSDYEDFSDDPNDFCVNCKVEINEKIFCFYCSKYLCDDCAFFNDGDIYDDLDDYYCHLFYNGCEKYKDVIEREKQLPDDCQRTFCKNCEFIENGYILK
jgi:hypothetical protein